MTFLCAIALRNKTIAHRTMQMTVSVKRIVENQNFGYRGNVAPHFSCLLHTKTKMRKVAL